MFVPKAINPAKYRRFMAQRRTLAIVASIVAILIVISAVGAYAVQTSGKKGTVQVYVKDAVGPWAHVNVTFNTLQIHRADATNTSGWTTLSIHNGTLDLVQFVNISALLGDGKVASGNYTQLRVDVVNVTGVMTNGTEVNFTVPSGQLKTTNPFSVVAGGTTRLTIDIDLEHSITNANGTWIFKPVLGSVTEG
jgi:hypothetical protein